MGMFNNEEEGKIKNQSSETVIGASVKVEGSFVGEGNVLVEGQIVGNLKTKGDLTVAEGAKIEADIEAENLMVSGEVTGNIDCHGKTELTPTAKVTGDIETKIISVQTGATIQGRCSTKKEDVSPTTKTEAGTEEETEKKKKK